MGDAKIPPVTVSFFIIFPTVALAFSVAILASPEPRSWAFFATLVITWVGLKGSSWFIYKSRDDVAKLEKVEVRLKKISLWEVQAETKKKRQMSQITVFNHK